MRQIALAFCVLAAVPLAPARADDRFDEVKSHAQRLDSLSGFLEKYIGDCKDPYERAQCEQHVKEARRSWQGKTLLVTLGDRAAESMQAQADGGQFRILFTPFIDGGGYALTHGQPSGQDSQGRPRIGYLVLKGTLPSSVSDMDFQSAFRTGNVTVELVFRPQGTWKMKRRHEEGYYEGVKAKFVGVRLVNARTGAEIATKVF